MYKRRYLTEARKAGPWLDTATEQEQLAAVQRNGFVIRYIKNPSDNIQLAAVQRDGLAIRYVINPALPIQIAAVQQDIYSIKLITNPSNVVQLAAMQQIINKKHRKRSFIEDLPLFYLPTWEGLQYIFDHAPHLLRYVKPTDDELAAQLDFLKSQQ